jgi:hypothetical protein
MTNQARRPLRRLALAGAALAALAAPMIAGSGCGSALDSISKIDALRVLAVIPAVLDDAHPTLGTEETGSYARPGDAVTFSMSYYDGYVDPVTSEPRSREPQILWLAGCYDPPGDAYYGCYQQLGEVLQNFDPAHPDLNYVGFGPSFTTKLPADIVSRRQKPEIGPYYGIAYVFFAVCAGTIKPIPPSGSGKAGSFPLGCFDEVTGQQLGADSFVPGYTQIYAFDDDRLNQNPKVKGFTIDGEPLAEGPDQAAKVARCTVSEDDRNAPPSCSKKAPADLCTTYKMDIVADDTVAELDPDSTSADGQPLKEVVWVDYFADKGDFDTEVRLVNDATTGLIEDHSTTYLPPTGSGLVTVWAVVHDARGGSTVLTRYLRVE